jgi:thiamine phosphate synthase YjbQ (UPF0047 family)
VDAIKIDVEGFELNVLKGAVKILKQHAPILIIEIWEPEQERDITSFLDRLGYSPKKILDARNYLFIKAKNDQSEHNS